jgi:hypothetical protein
MTVVVINHIEARRARVRRRRANGNQGFLLPVEREVSDFAEQKRLHAAAWRLGFIMSARAAALDAGDADQAAMWLRELLDLQREVAAA